MVMYDNEFETKENKILTNDKTEPQHIHYKINRSVTKSELLLNCFNFVFLREITIYLRLTCFNTAKFVSLPRQPVFGCHATLVA